MNSLVSIIIPAYNSEKYIFQCISSILKQTHSNLEILVADDGSTDSTRQIIDSFEDARIRSFHNTINKGVVFTRNQLMEKAAGEFITFQDADDWSPPDRISRQLDAFEKDKDLFVCFTQHVKTDGQGKMLFVSEFPSEWELIKSRIPDTFPFTCASMMIRREVYEQIGGYHPYFNRTNDEDLYWISMIVLNYKSINLSYSGYFYRFNEDSLTKRHSRSESKKFYINHLTRLLIHQYQQTGTNYLLEENYEKLREIELAYEAPFIADKSYSLYLAGEKHLFWGNYKAALKYAHQAIVANFTCFRNYKLFAASLLRLIKP